MTYISGQMRYKLRWVSYIVSKRHELWSTNGLNWNCIYTRPPKILRFSSLPCFAHAHQATELNQTLPHSIEDKPR